MMPRPSLRGAFLLVRTGSFREHEVRRSGVAPFGHHSRSATHGSTGREFFHLGVHVSERNAVVTFQELDAAGREKMALRKPELSERYAEGEEAIVA
jgi:hypothetical protein